MSESDPYVIVLRQLYWLHMDAARKKDEPLRLRRFALIEEYSREFPDADQWIRESARRAREPESR